MTTSAHGPFAGWVLLLGWLAGCAPPPAEPPPVQRLAFLDAGADPAEREPRTVAAWDAEALLEVVEVVEGRAELVRAAGESMLFVSGSAELALRPGLPAGAFDRALMEVRVSREASVHVSGFSGRLVGRQTVRIEKGLQEVELALPWTHRANKSIERLKIRFTGSAGGVFLHSLTLTGTAREAWLPPPDEPDLIELGLDVRPATGLGSRPLVTEFEARAGQRLAFAHGTPPELVDASVPVGLEVRLECDGGAPGVHPYESPHGAWARETVPLTRDGRYRASFTLTDGGAGGALVALGVPKLERAVEQPPRVVLVTLDTHRADHVGVAGADNGVRTPALDALANRGTYFEDCLSAGNTTGPSHVSLMTGLPIRDHRVIGNDIGLASAAPTLAEAFAGAGWRTWAAVSIPHVGTHSGLGQGFDRVGMPDGFRPAADTVALLESWLAQPLDVPTFIWLHVFDPHSPYDPEEEQIERYWPSGRDPFDPATRVQGWKAPTWAWRVTDPEYVIALYRAEVTGQDGHLARVFEHPELEPAVWAVVADHGEHMLSWQGNFRHGGLGPATLNVPLVLAGPGVPSGARVSRPVSSPDLGRTLLDLAGHRRLPFPGRNLLAPAEEGEPVRFAIGGNANEAAVRSGRWLLVQRLRAAPSEPPPGHAVALYDVERDPEQLEDLAADRPEVAQELRTQLVEWLTTEGAIVEHLVGDARRDAETRAELAELGYAESGGLPGGSGWIDPACACPWCERFPLVR